MIFQSLGSLSLTSLGASSLAAAAANLPYDKLRLLAAWLTLPKAAVHSLAGTPHWAAAAAISISRAVAPALRKYSCELRMVRLPTVAMSPYARLVRRFSCAVAYSMRTFFQSASNSSATNMGAEVRLPWPISVRA